MRLHAYVLAADPNFLRESVLSYYDLVDHIVVSYDENGRSWTGTELPVGKCLDILRDLDVKAKCDFVPGHFARPEHPPLDNDTHQRQVALDSASAGADWVLQLDTDEVVPNPRRFAAAVSAADQSAAGGMEYPSRWLYARIASGRYLETSTRFGRISASFPGPLAVRAGTRLRLARQADAALYRLDVRPWNSDTFHPRTAIVHEVVAPEDAVVHYSWVRADDYMRRKFAWSGHRDEYDRPEVYRRWVWRASHPRLTSWSRPLRRSDWYRIAEIPDAWELV